ncbi:MAG: hypothetical protein ISS26_01020 [Candidatus Omnitrophica bacterium]|nr:hypothetical protein [Candidatus Omnitrophota bacterium]
MRVFRIFLIISIFLLTAASLCLAGILPAAETGFSFNPNKPDLVISEIQHFPINPLVGETLTFTVVVKNIGTELASNVKVEIAGQKGWGKSGLIRFIAPGASQTVFLRVNADESHAVHDPHSFIFTVDPEDGISEQDEGNNIFFKYLRVNFSSHKDLMISDVRLTPTNPQAGGDLVFTVNVSNVGGSVGKDVEVEVYDQRGWRNKDSIDYILPGGNKSIAISLKADDEHFASNPHSFTVKLDPANVIAESNELNNLYSVPTLVNIAKVGLPSATPPADTPAIAISAANMISAKQAAEGEHEMVAEAYMAPVEPVLPIAKDLYYDLQDQIDGIKGHPDLLQKGEFDSSLRQLTDEAESHNVFIKTELGSHFSQWHQYPYSKYHKDNTFKALAGLKKDLNITEAKGDTAETEELKAIAKLSEMGVVRRPDKGMRPDFTEELSEKRSELSQDEKELKGLLESFLSIPIVSPIEVMQDTIAVFKKMGIRYRISEPDKIVANAETIMEIGSFYGKSAFSKRLKFKRLMSEIVMWEQNITKKISLRSLDHEREVSEGLVAKYGNKVAALSEAFDDNMLDVDRILRSQLEVVREAEKAFLD